MPLTRHAYPVLQLRYLQNFGLTYVYVVDPGAEQWPDKIVGLRMRHFTWAGPGRRTIFLFFHSGGFRGCSRSIAQAEDMRIVKLSCGVFRCS